MGIHDSLLGKRNILSAPHTYDRSKRAANLRALADFGPKDDKPKGNKKVKKEAIEGALDQVYAVQKPYSGCQLTALVHPIDPLKGLEGHEIVPDQIHGVYHDQEAAQSAAEQVYNEHVKYEQALEEKKTHVIDKIKEAMDGLEKQRTESVDMIKENPKDAGPHREKVAQIATKIDHLVNQLQRIEASKKIEPDKDKDKKKADKKKVEEALKKALTVK